MEALVSSGMSGKDLCKNVFEVTGGGGAFLVGLVSFTLWFTPSKITAFSSFRPDLATFLNSVM